jgi:hypothetical protein
MRTCHAACGRQQQMEYAQCTGTGLSGDIWCAGIFLHFRIFVRRQYENLASVLEAESDDTFLPWICCETLLWLYVVLRKGGISVSAWLLFLLGYHHTTYYLTILVVFYVLYWKIHKPSAIRVLNVISVISMLETGWNVGIFHRVNTALDSYYLNPFNWMLFFGTGLLIRQKAQEAERSIRWSNSLGNLCVCASIVYFSVHAYFGLEMYYFSRYAVIGNLLNLGTVAYLGQILMHLKKKELLLKLGDWFFAVYLLHQFVVGIVVAVTNHWDCFFAYPMPPLDHIGDHSRRSDGGRPAL